MSEERELLMKWLKWFDVLDRVLTSDPFVRPPVVATSRLLSRQVCTDHPGASIQHPDYGMVCLAEGCRWRESVISISGSDESCIKHDRKVCHICDHYPEAESDE